MQIPDRHEKDWLERLKQIQQCKSEGYYTVQQNVVNSSRKHGQKIQEYSNQKYNVKKGLNVQNAEQLSYQHNFKIMHAGYLEKKTLNMTWKERYFCLTQSRLLYYSDHHQLQLKGCFNFGSLLRFDLKVISIFPEITLKVNTIRPSLICDREQKIILRLKIQNQKQHSEWTQLIQKSLQGSLRRINFFPKIGQQIRSDTHTIVGQKQNYWNKIKISSKQLISYADHLDLIFFRSKGVLAAVNRFFMRSQYDHIGILIKGEISELYIFQAIQSRGVWVLDWDTLMENFENSYEQIGYRKIFIPQKQKICPQKLEDYINTLIGKKYELSFSKLLSGNLQPEIQMANSNSKFSSNSYFCSQLVADVYMKFGLLKKGKKHQYWPKQFQRSIELQKGASLGPMMSVEMKK